MAAQGSAAPQSEESRHFHDGYTETPYYEAFTEVKVHPPPKVDSAGNLVAMAPGEQPVERVVKVRQSPAVGSKPSRSEFTVTPADKGAMQHADSMTMTTGTIAERIMPALVARQPVAPASGDHSEDDYVQTEYYKASRPGRTSFDRERMQPSNSVGDLQTVAKE
ncbi:hypothetical protein WJX73_004852 [Symbiochloris irregularis]|uniref:Uncharacterized protein n=1 Tax=Symbiochloris irregularis TaxID=706552 RepID=A0AAW1NPL6_9CHLO